MAGALWTGAFVGTLGFIVGCLDTGGAEKRATEGTNDGSALGSGVGSKLGSFVGSGLG